MNVYMGGLPIADGQNITWIQAQQPLSVHFPFDSKLTYIFLIYDPDSPKPHGFPFVHLLVTDLHNDDLLSGRILISYYPPNPPGPPLSFHHYRFEVYQQMGPAPVLNYDRLTLDLGLLTQGMPLLYHQEIMVSVK